MTAVVRRNVVGIYKVALTHKKLGITKELLANKVVPFLFPLCIDSGLNLTQVGLFSVVLHEQWVKPRPPCWPAKLRPSSIANKHGLR